MSDQPQQPLAPTMEYIDAGGPVASSAAVPPASRKSRTWVPIVAGLVAFFVVLIGAGLVAADWVERNVEMRALVTNVEASEAAMTDVQAAVAAMAVHFDPNTPLTDAERAAVDEELKAIAADGAAAIAAAGGNVAAVTVLPWHRGIIEARDAYVAHNKAWQDYLTAASQDPAEFAKTQDNVNATFAAAEQPMRDAVPVPPLFDLKERIDVIFAPPPVQDGGPTQEA